MEVNSPRAFNLAAGPHQLRGSRLMYSPSQNDPTSCGLPLHRSAPARTARWLGLRDDSQLDRALWIAALLLWAAYVAYFAQLSSFPFQDYPNHLARASILADLIFHGGHRFAAAYNFHFTIAPYVLHDTLLTGLVAAFGVVAGGAVFTTMVLLSLPCALIFYMRANQLAPRAELFVLITSLYLATDWFFLMGFMAFRLALAFIIVSMALADLLRKSWRPGLFAWYVVTLTAGYLTHLTSLVFFAPVLGVSGVLRSWFRTSSVRREILLWIPVAALLAVHFAFIAIHHDAAHPASYAYYWGTVHDKLHHLNWEFERFDGRPSPVMMYTLVACVVWAIWRHIRLRTFVRPEVIEHLALAAAFFVLYWLLPSAYQDSTFVDVRALCMVALFLLFACLHALPAQDRGQAFAARSVLAVAIAVVCLNLAYLVLHMHRNEAWLERYRRVVAAIPAGTRVLPIYTQESQMDIAPFLHAASYVTMDRAAIIPYLFSGDRGDLMTYFEYRQRPYTPEESWYEWLKYWNQGIEATYEVEGRRYTWRFHYDRVAKRWNMVELVPVDWNRVACEYDFLLVTLPFREPYIEVPFRPVAYNETAALLAVDKHACHPGVRPAREVRLPLER
jgi:hypothetical protein